MPTIRYRRVIHLSHRIKPEIPLWPGDPPIAFETVAAIERDGYALRRLCMGEHSATHVNAPLGFDADGAGVDAYPAGALVAPAAVIDVSRQAAADRDYAVTADEVGTWELAHGTVPAGGVVLLHTGWQAKWTNPAEFLGNDEDGGLHFPGFGADVTRFLLDERGIGGLGTDTHGVDPGQDLSYASNRLTLARGGIVLENVANLDQLPPTGATLAIGLLRLHRGTGSPAAVLALVP